MDKKKSHYAADENKKSQSIENEKETVMNEEKKTENQDKKKSSKKSKAKKEKELQEKIDDLNDKHLRLFSEFDNYRKRTAREKIELIGSASANLIEELLPVVDDFERAIESNEKIEGCDIVKEGIVHIYNKLYGTLEKNGLKSMDSLGKEFDTDFHEAITYIPAPSEDEKGKVADVVQRGYLLNDKVIRYAKVVIWQ
jgi:molecular chaperone GrpE